jgi:hypothetical protein
VNAQPPVGRRTGRRSTTPRRVIGIAGAVALSAVTVAACSSSVARSPAGGPTSGTAPVPLASSLAGPTGTWATVAMGRLDDPFNTFWQVFSLPAATSPWVLATPPAVASNGGLVMSAGAPRSLTAGYEPFELLRWSPLAQTGDGGTVWSPGVLPGALAAVPDSLAAGTDPTRVALLRGNGGDVVVSTGDLSTWKSVGSTEDLAARGALPGCGVAALTAVGVLANGDPIAGAACTHGGTAGVLVLDGGSWHAVPPSLPASTSGPVSVIRLVGTVTGATALIRAGSGRGSRLFAAWSTDGLATWSVSSPLSMRDQSLVSTGLTAGGGLIAVTSGPNGSRSAAVIEHAGGWRNLAPLPEGTVVVASTPSGGFDALVVRQSTLEVAALEPGGWSHAQTIHVAIQYGSSG